MNTRRSWMLRMAIMGCGLVALTLLVGNADAGKQQTQLWPSGAKLTLRYVNSWPLGNWLEVYWPSANSVDHYRMTAWRQDGKTQTLLTDTSPASSGALVLGLVPGNTCVVRVTAYAGPNESTAYSEILQAKMTIR